MQDLGSRKDRYNFHNHLTAVLKALENKHTIIDLRNESCVSGLIKNVDGSMNVEMESVTFYDPQGHVHSFKDFYVSARNIRYVHIPEGFSCMELLEKEMGLLQKSTVREKRKDNFKSKRAKLYNAAILQDIQRSNPGPSKSN